VHTNPLVVIDADNTLWDTDAVYAEAQLELLQRVENAVDRNLEGNSERRLLFVRQLDQELAASHPAHLRYPPALLAAAIRRALVDGFAASTDITEDVSWSRAAAVHFVNRIQTRIPKLRKGVVQGLAKVASISHRLVLVTEGDRKRCKLLLETHKLQKYFNDIVHGQKSPPFYSNLLARWPHDLGINVGDQLDRDVAFASEAGFVTVHFPSAFTPFWVSDIQVIPDFVINTFGELPGVMRSVLAEARSRTSDVRRRSKPVR
jgi:putative hydrolase of the HAD superfamily